MNIIPAAALTLQEALSIYEAIMENHDDRDEDAAYLLDNLIRKSVYYANIRAEWDLKSREQKMEADSGRTIAHDALISAVSMIARYQKEEGRVWLARLGKDDRKRIGDFGCYIALFRSLQAR